MIGKNHLYAKSGGTHSPQTFLIHMDLLCDDADAIGKWICHLRHFEPMKRKRATKKIIETVPNWQRFSKPFPMIGANPFANSELWRNE